MSLRFAGSAFVVCCVLLLQASMGQAAQPGTQAGGSASGTGAEPTTTLHVEVKLVNVFTSVTDANGALVGGLSREDFAVSDNGQPQRIAVFERQSNLPLNLVLAIDTSGSVRKDISAERDAAKHFVRALMRPQDEVSLMEFSTEVREVVGFTKDARKIENGLNHLEMGAATALYDAIDRASRSLAQRDGRKVLVLVTDGGDTADTVSYAQALRQALLGEVMVYSLIDVPVEASAGRDTGGEHALITLAEQTGGKYFYVDQEGLNAAFARVSEDLRTQYLIGYYPKDSLPGVNFHRIRITIPRADARAFEVRYRTGYYGDETGQD